MSGKSILIVDDDKGIRDSLTWVLEYQGYWIRSAVNGQDGLQSLEQDPLPVLILLDMMMPVMNGWEFREQLKANSRTYHIPVVILTAKKNLEKSIEKYPNERLLIKPFEIEDLMAIIEAL